MACARRGGLNGGLLRLVGGLLAAAAASTALAVVDLGTAGTYSVLSSTFTRNGGNSALSGNAGFTTLSGVGTHTVGGVNYQPAPPQAGIDQGTALAALNGTAATYPFAVGPIDLASVMGPSGTVGIFEPGVYHIDGAMNIGGGGTITLNGPGIYIFRSTGAFDTTDNSQVLLTGGASAADVYWVPAAATTLGANTTFLGTIIDDAGITSGATTSWAGRALAFNGTVTLDTDAITVPTAAVAAAISLTKTSAGMGSAGNVMLTVTNTGQVIITNLVGQISVAGPAAYTAPSPVVVASLTPGSAVTFTWTASPTGGGNILFTAYAGGDAGSGTIETAHRSGAVEVPAGALDARLNAAKTTVTVGQGVQIILTVTNTGGSPATNVKATAWSSTITGTGPVQAPQTIAAGAKTTFIWTVTPTAGLAGQTIFFTASAAGDGLTPTVWSSATVTVQSAPAITAKVVTTSLTISGGGKFLVILTVSNSGQAAVSVNVTNTAWVASVANVIVTPLGTPTPTFPATIASGVSVSFTWTVTAKGVTTGLVLSNTIYLTDSNGGPALANLWVKTNAVALVGLGALTSKLVAFRTSEALGQPVQFVLTLTNTGGTTVENITAALWADSVGTALSGPVPASLVALAPGKFASFTWTATPPDSAGLKVHASAFGFTASVTGAIQINAPQADADLAGIPTPELKVAFVFPAPARESANIGYTMASAGTVKIRVYNETGQLAAVVEEAKPAGVQSSALATARLAPGVYYFLLTREYDAGGSDKTDMRKFLVVH